MKRALDATVDVKEASIFTSLGDGLAGGLPIRLHYRTDLHLMRKVFHMVLGLVIVFCYLAGTSRSMGVLILGSVLGFDLLIEATRLHVPSFNEKMVKIWSPFMRAHETNRMSTIPHYVAAATIAIGIFPKPVAVLSLLYLACGDPMASLAGILYGDKSYRFPSGKSIIGTLAGVSVCAAVTFIYLKTLSIASDGTIVLLSLLGGLAGGLVELLPFDVDDNFTIPVVSGFIMWAVFIAFGV